MYIRYVADERINEEFLFCQPLETTSSSLALKKEHALSYFRTKRSQVVFDCKTKNGALLAFGGDKFSTYLAYLADILYSKH